QRAQTGGFRATWRREIAVAAVLRWHTRAVAVLRVDRRCTWEAVAIARIPPGRAGQDGIAQRHRRTAIVVARARVIAHADIPETGAIGAIAGNRLIQHRQ